MAGNEIGGFLNITPDVLNKLNSFDEKLEKIQQHSKTAAEALKNGFSSVVVDTSKLESAITSLSNKISSLGSKGNPFEGVSKGAGDTERKTTSMNESLSRAAQLLNQIGGSKISQNTFSGFNIATLKEGISDLKKFVENTKTLSKVEQQRAVDAMRYMKMQLDYQRQTDEQRVQSAEKAAQRKEAADRRAAKAAEQLARQQEIAQRTTPQGALDYSRNAKYLRDQVTAINYLKQARLSLTTTDTNYRQTLEQINQAIARHNQALQQAGAQSQQLGTRQRNLMDTAGQLQRQLALVFSVSQIEGYISKIVEVRGQLELQQVALRAIVQDKDKADRIFSQTMQQALKSPFKAMELVTFTKQLAAYRIESDKLFDTTKRLADVSAGLGVDMGRLILAYGQVKAAAYLRGTEVRQFTEAGINMYGELQSYFQEIKGEAYTTAQIVDMISNRMVKFEDVEAVFQRMTDKGGLFFNMQEVQVNTLHGQIERLKDVIISMQNDIGKSNQEGFLSISTAIELANTLLENWRTVASIIKTVVLSYGALKAVSGVMWLAERVSMTKDIAQQRVRISLKWKDIMATRAQAAANAANGTAIAGAATAQRGLNAALASNPYGAILAVITAVGVAIYEVVQNTNRLKEALDGIAAEGAFSVVQSSNNYAQLASVVTDSTKSYQEHNKALAELKRKYSDILPEQYLNAEGIKALNGNYNEAIEIIKQYINAKTKERMIDEIGTDASKEMYSNQQKTAKAISEIIEEQHGMKVSWNEISGILSQVQDKLMNGTIKSVQQLREETEKVVEEYTGLGNIDLSDYFTQLSGGFGSGKEMKFGKVQIENRAFRDWFESAKSYLTKIKEIENRFNKDALSMTAQRYQEQKDETDKMIANAMSAYDVLRESQKKNSKVTKEELENAKNLVQKVLKAIGSNVEVNSEYINKLFNDSFFFEEEKQKATQAKLKQLFDKLAKEAKESGDTSGAVWLQEFEKQIYGLNLNPLQNSIKKFLQEVGGNEDIQANWNIRSGETEAEFKKRIKSEIDTRNEIIRKSQSSVYPKYGQDTSKVKSELEELNRLYNELGGDKKKGRSNAERDIWSERISVLKEMQSRYEKLNKLMGENRAIEETRSAFKGAFGFTGMGDMNILPTKEGMIKAYEELLKSVTDSKKITELKKIIAELKIEIQQDQLKEQLDITKQNIESMFNSLDLHQKLKDAGLSEAEVQALFPGLAKTLDEVQKGIEIEFQTKYADAYKDPNTQQYKDYQDAIKKIEQQRIKESQDLVVELTKAYKTQLSDQLQLDRWYYEERAKIAKANLTEEQREQYNKNLTSQYNMKSDENTWKQFQESDFYIDMFQNLDNVSTKTLVAMRDKLEQMKEQLSGLKPTQVRSIVNNMEKLNEVLAGRNPFKELIPNLKSYIGSLKDRKKHEDAYLKALKEQEDIEKRLYGYTKTNEDGSKERVEGESEVLAKLEAEYNAIVENKDATQAQKDEALAKLNAAKEVVKRSEEELANNKQITDQKKEQVDADKKKLDAANKSLSEVAKYGAEAVNAVSEFTGMLESFGVEIPEWLEGTTEGLGKIFDGLGSIDLTKPFSIVTGTFKTIAGIGKTIGSIFGIGNKDKKKEREIQRQIDSVERLQKAYDVLKEKMDNAWSAVSFSDMNKQTLQNVDAQIASYQAMIKAEQDKKKTDNDRIKEWQDAIEELKKTRKELEQQAIEEMGGIGETNYKDAAQAFADAWVDAFNESEDALLALQDTFDDYITNLIKKQAMMRLVQARMKSVFEAIDKSVTEGSAGGINLTKEELVNIQKMGESALAGLNEDLLALMETLGYKPSGEGTAELSALTQSIQGITEKEAEALEALLNSIRFFVSQQTTDISAIRALLDARYSLESEYSDANPMLVELRAQTRYLEILSDRIDRVFAPSPNSKGPALRVVMQ